MYRPTLPSINWTRQGLSVYPSAAGRSHANSEIAVIARFGKAVLRREPNEESPESRRLFGAVWGAQPQRSPRGKHGKAKRFTQKRALPRRRLRSSFLHVSPSSVGIAIKKRAIPK